MFSSKSISVQNQQRELTVRHAKETEKEMKQRLDIQKEEYEETIKRHLGFIDQVCGNNYVNHSEVKSSKVPMMGPCN